MTQWIEWLNDRNAKLPESGYVEYVTTWDDNDTGCLDINTVLKPIPSYGYDMLWNRAAPRCVKKFRVVDRKYYVDWKKKSLSAQINQTLNTLTDQMNEFRGYLHD